MRLCFGTAAGLLCVAGLAGPAVAGTCNVSPVPLASQADVESHMSVSAGTACGMNISLPGAIKGIRILQMPKSGMAGIRGSVVVYAPKPGFQGRDEFVYTYEGTEAYGGAINITIHQKVDVVP